MYILYILNTFLLINTVAYTFNYNPINLHNDLKKLSLLSKLIYDYNYLGNHPIKKNYIINNNNDINLLSNLNSNEINNISSEMSRINIDDDITFDFVQKNNIYFNLMQFITYLNNQDFIKNTEEYFDILNKNFPYTEIYGYFYNKNRLHSLILINHKYEEIIVVFRGSQYNEEWFKNLLFFEKTLEFNKKFKIHSGIYNMYTNNDIDKNIIYILENLFKYFPKYRKIFTGHSKGSTNSILLALELLSKFNDKYNYDIFTFGNPQIFNYDLASFLHNNKNIKIFNVINEPDIITTIPFLNKYQFGLEIILKDNNILINEHNKPYKLSFFIKKLYSSIINHDLTIYIKKIFNNIF
jgi:hypothetical protein